MKLRYNACPIGTYLEDQRSHISENEERAPPQSPDRDDMVFADVGGLLTSRNPHKQDSKPHQEVTSETDDGSTTQQRRGPNLKLQDILKDDRIRHSQEIQSPTQRPDEVNFEDAGGLLSKTSDNSGFDFLDVGGLLSKDKK